MKIKFLGTGGVMGVPVWNCDCKTCTSEDKKNKRYRSSIMVEIEDKVVVIDFGQDFRNQLIDNNIKKIDYAFLTHAHRDHCGGVEQLSTADNCIFEASSEVLEQFYEKEGSSRNWLTTRNKTLEIRPFKKKKIRNVEIDTVKLEHKKDFTTSIVYCNGYIFKSPEFKFAYMTDYNKILEPEKVKDLDLIISDGNGFENVGHGHVGVKGSIEVYKELKPKKMILTHIRHTTEHNETQEYVKQFGNIEIAYDGMEIEI